jgi:hypothetical protein
MLKERETVRHSPWILPKKPSRLELRDVVLTYSRRNIEARRAAIDKLESWRSLIPLRIAPVFASRDWRTQLILISGYPSAGKTTRALQLKEHLETAIANATANARVNRLKVHVINDQTLGLSRNVYHTAKAEKDARAEEYSAVKRLLSRDDIVIADGMNYIKGFRYQLYCEAKALQTPSCVVSSHSSPQ